MKLTLERLYKKEKYTIGKLYINDVYYCDTLEDCDRNLTTDMPIEEIEAKKVYGETAIPRGLYEIKMTYSPKFHNRTWAKLTSGKVPQVMNVPCWSGVRFHPANEASQLLGCIAPGKNTKKGMVTSSTHYYTVLVIDYIFPAIEQGEKVYLEIV